MTARNKTNRKSKSSLGRKRRQSSKQSNALNFEMLEARQLLAAITVSNATDILSATSDTSSIAALVANDGGDGISLREAVTAANNTAGEDAITFDASVFTGGDNNVIRLTQGELSISDSLNIDGSSVGGVLITGDANNDDITITNTNVTNVSASFGGTAGASDDLLDDNSRVLSFAGSGDLTLTGLTITGGRETAANADGAGIRFNSSGTLSLDQSTVSGNSTPEDGGAGGGIAVFDGNVSLIRSTVSGNSGNSGGGIHSDSGDVSLTNSTVSGNTALGRNGGGIEITDGDLSLLNSTVTNNDTVGSFGRGGGVAFYSSFAQLTILNSIVAGNITRASFLGPDLLVYGIGSGDLIVESSLIGNTEETMISESTGTGNILDQRPLLTPLGNNGGATQTHGLLRGSPAIDAGSNALAVDTNGAPLATDQRGGSRILGTVDIGAFELRTEADFETQSLVVNINQDVANPFDGFTSLREAIGFANDLAAGVNSDGDADGDGSALDTITFDSSVFTGGDNSLIRLTQGDLSISDSLNIDGSSVGGVVITGDANDDDITVVGTNITDVSASFGGTAEAADDLLDDNSRVLDFLTTGSLTLTDLTITGGRATDSNDIYDFRDRGNGGGIRAYDGGEISLFNSTVSGNSATGSIRGDGGGIFSSFGSVSLTNSLVSGNRTLATGRGGGIFGGSISLTNSVVSANSAGEFDRGAGSSDGNGGGVFSSSDVTLINSTISGNSSVNRGGGISATTVLLNNSAVSGNVSDQRGGGISAGNLTSTDSIVSGNISRDAGGGIYIAGGVASLTNSTVSGNNSESSGGGIFTSFAEVYLTNSTVDGNSSSSDGGGIFSSSLGTVSVSNSTLSGNTSGRSGGAIGTYRSTVMLDSSTVTGNSAAALGGGIRFDNRGESLTLYNSIVADNGDDGTAPDISASAAVTNAQYSLIGDTTGFGITSTTGLGNIFNQLPLLGPLADNGGRTRTHALLEGSPALNAGSNAFVTAAGLTTDQRGEARIESSTVDIGAFEVGVQTSLIVTTNLDVEDQTDGLISLREAIALANGDVGLDTIAFDPSVFDGETTIAIASQLPTITDALTITGPGANLLIIDAQGGGDNVLDGSGFRIVEVSDGDSTHSIDVSISGLTLTGGDISDSGGAINNFENLTLDGVSIVANQAQFGGGISNELSGVLSLTNSTIASNEASQDGGGISTRGALTATNVTISGNSAVSNGAAIVTAGDSSGSTLNLTQVTLTDNTGNEGVYFNSVDGPTIATFNNSIIDNPVTGVGNNGTTLAGGYNLFASSNPGIAGAGNLFNQTSMLGPLADNGGSTLTHALLLGSPAYNAGSTALALDRNGNLLLTDQRGESRNQFLTVDIGAVESGADIGRGLVVTTSLDVDDPFDGLTSLREAIAFATDPVAGVNNDGDVDGDGLDADTITFDAGVFAGGDNNVIRLTQGAVFIDSSLRIDGASVGGVVITGDANGDDVTLPGTSITDVSSSFGGTIGASDDLLNDNSKVLLFGADQGDLTLTGLTITGGNSTRNYSDGGGILFGSSTDQNFTGTLTLNQTIVSGNSTMGPYANGGGIHSNGTTTVLIDSAVSGNFSTGRGSNGGGISLDGGGGLLLTNSTVIGNSSIGSGGGIRNVNGPVTLINSTVNGNSGNRGGGISSPFADVTLTDSTVSGNVGDGDGGGIYSRTDILLTGSIVSENVSGNDGGGIFSQYGDVSLINSTVIANVGDRDGGGIHSDAGIVSLNNSTVTENVSDGNGGGIYSRDADLLLTGSTVSGNSTQTEGGGIYSRSGDLSLISSSVSGNVSGGLGGGIHTEFGDVSLTNSTVSGNSTTNALADGGGIYSRNGDLSSVGSTLSGNVSGGSGGGIRVINGDVSLTNSTLSGNSASYSGGGLSSSAATVLLVNSTVTANSASETGGGIAVNANNSSFYRTLTIRNSILAGNEDNGTAPDSLFVGGIVNELLVESSLVGNTTGSGINFTIGTGNILNQSPLLGPLADNGGPTQTHALLSGSLGINVGSNSIAAAAGLIVDQRGEDRVQSGLVDIGAFESDLSEGNFFVTTIQDVFDPDDEFISLREAITFSNLSDSINTIAFAPNVLSGPTTIEILSQLPTIVFPLTITGPGADLLTIDAQGGGDDVLDGDGFGILEVNDGDSTSSVDVSISGLTLTGGDTSNAGGAISNFENLVLNDVSVVGNRANFGGGINNEVSGVLAISNSTIANNESSQDGGGISNRGDLTATQVTVSGNDAAGSGGAIFAVADFSGAILNLTQSTLTNNTGSDGVHLDNGGVIATVTFNNTIIDSPIAGIENDGTILTGSNNLFASADPGIVGTGNLFSQASLLGPLATNGGSTLTHALLFGSPAIDAGGNALAVDDNGNPLATDQRGEARVEFGTVDIGAFETEFGEARSLVVTTTQDVENVSDGLTSLREAIAFALAGVSNDGDADGDGLRADTITFDPSVFTGGDSNLIRLTEGELQIGDSLTIDGSAVGGVVITGDAGSDDITLTGTNVTDVSASFGGALGDLLDDNSRVLNFSAGSGDLTLTDLTITGGRVTGNFDDGGGIEFNSNGTLTLNQSTVSGNSVAGNRASGGGIFASNGDLSLADSTVSGNSSGDSGGGISSRSGAAFYVSLANSTVSGNTSNRSGGGIQALFADVLLTNSTVSGNSSGTSGGGIFTSRDLLLTNSTVTDNSASLSGGGIAFSSSNGSSRLLNSIVAGNGGNSIAPDLLPSSGVTNNLIVENSLIGDITRSGITSATGTGNILNQSPLLGPLADNGGPTQTHALLSGSTAINAGSNAIATAAELTADQRGEERFQFGAVDIGAFESELNERIFFVTTSQDVEDPDDGFISLREAILFANERDSSNTITFDPNVFNVPTLINISSQLPTITEELTITGLGADLLTIDAQGGGDDILDGNGFRIFEVNDGDAGSSIDVSISGLTLTGGDNNDFGGAISNFENLTLDGVAIVGNRSVFGGGVSNDLSGRLTLSNSTIANNEVSQDGGGIFNGGELSATNVTISGNSAAINGSGIVSGGDLSGVMLSLTNVTLTNNTGSEGVYFDSGVGPTTASFNNTIIDSPITSVGYGTTLAGSNNLFAGADPGITGTGNLFNQSSMLAPLADNGGPTLTHALLFGSPAIDAGDTALAVNGNGISLTTDQRGEDRVRFGAIDIGAFETTEFRSLTVTTTEDVVDQADGVTSLREAIAFAFSGLIGDGDADGDGLRADTITFDPSVFTGGENSVIRLTQGQLSISDTLTIDGSSVGGVVITGDVDGDDILVAGTQVTDVSASRGIDPLDDLLDDNSRVFDFLDSDLFGGSNVTLTGLTITGGRVPEGEKGGGIQFNSNGTLTLNQSAVSGNFAAGSDVDGGGIYSRSGDVSLNNSSVTGNFSDEDGGGIRTIFGDLSLTNSTVSGNISARDGGGIITSFGGVTLINSTISGNTSGRDGGGIGFNDSQIILANSTVTGNSASRVGGGISFRSQSFFQRDSLSLQNSIVAGNTDDGSAPDVQAVGGAAIDLVVEHSLIGDSTGSEITTASGTGNILNQSALLGPLADNGGPTLTHALLPGSPAIDAGDNALAVDEGGNTLTTAQRGENRFNGTVDIGAFEFIEARSLVVTTSQDIVDPIDGLVSLREAIAAANDPTAGINNDGDADGDGFPSDTITFEGSVFFGGDDNVIRLTQGELIIDESLSIDGSSVGGVLITGDANGDDVTLLNTEITDLLGSPSNLLDDNTRVLNFSGPTGNLTLTNLTVTGGQAGGFSEGGGIRFGSSGMLTISDSTISGNSGYYGGGVYTDSGNVAVASSTISGNSNTGYGAGGGIYSSSGNVSVTNSTIGGNNSYGGGGISAGSGSVYLNSSTINGNSSRSFDGGGAILTDSGNISVINSTISGNSNIDTGGGVSTGSGNVLITNSTIVGNSGGGVSIVDDNLSSALTITNSIVAGNVQNSANSTPLDLVLNPDVSLTINRSLIGVGDNLGTTSGNLVGTQASPLDPRLGPLADNGGLTLTHALLPGSPAIGAGSNALALDENGNQLTTDQRGENRFVETVDIGALESEFDDPFLLGDTNLDGEIDFDDIAPLINLLANNSFLNEADIDRDGEVTFDDISPFISLLAAGGSAQFSSSLTAPVISSAAVVTPEAKTVEPPESSLVSVVTSSASESFASVNATIKMPDTTKTSLPQSLNADSLTSTVSQDAKATTPLPAASLVFVSDSLATPVIDPSELSVADTTITGATPIDGFVGPVAATPANYSFLRVRNLSFRGIENNRSFLTRRSLARNAQSSGSVRESRDVYPSTNVSTEDSFSTAAELFDANPESLDGVFDFEFEEAVAGLIE